MASEEDNFDIDIYGDGGEDQQLNVEDNAAGQDHISPAEPMPNPQAFQETQAPADEPNTQSEIKVENGKQNSDTAQKIASTDASAADAVQLPKQAPQEQGFEREDGSTDNRLVDPKASTALLVSDLHWWVNDDDVRGWANQCRCENELDEITFSEHKVNGKSKGQAYILFKSPQAATAAKQKIESFGEGQKYTKKFAVEYSVPHNNPFKTLPKDGPMRNSGPTNASRSTPGAYNGSSSQSNGSYNNSAGGYRGGRGGGYNNRGGSMNTGYNRGGFNQPMASGFQGPSMGGFQNNPMGNMSNYGGFQNRGGMGGMRGGANGMRGGRGGIMAMPMGGMNFGAMGMGMGMGMNMPQMGATMGMQGMQGSQNYPVASPAGYRGSLVSPTVPTHFPTLQNRQLSHPGRHTGPPTGRPRGFPSISSLRVGHALNTWASYTQYSSPSVGNSTANPSSSSAYPLATPPFTDTRTMLKCKLSFTGQMGNQTHFNPAMFNQQQAGTGDATWNPHGAKRTRQE